jgi:hypothetical protein
LGAVKSRDFVFHVRKSELPSVSGIQEACKKSLIRLETRAMKTPMPSIGRISYHPVILEISQEDNEMINYKIFTQKDMDVLKPILKSLNEQTKFNISLEYLIDGWEHFISEVEESYQGCIENYHNDLTKRDSLEEIINKCNPSLQQKLNTVIQPLDERFYAATNPLKASIIGPMKDQEWYFRAPKKLVADLKEDLEPFIEYY